MSGGKRMALAAWLAAAGPARAATVETLVDGQLLGGRYGFGGEKGALGANASLSVVPAVRVNDGLSVVPVLDSAYRGTKQVLDLVGAGTIFQEQWDNRLGARAVLGSPDGPWRVKPNVGYKYELLKETKDESWGRGLFDSWKLSGGVEVEYVYAAPYSVRASLDDFVVSYPNYATLESQAGTDLEGRPLARDLAGRRALDHHGQTAAVSATARAGRFVLEPRLSLQHVRYPGQHHVDATGAFGPDVREDFRSELSLVADMPAELNTDLRLLGHASLGGAYNGSDEDAYDATQLRYLPGYFRYGELDAAAGGKLLYGDRRRPVTLSAGLVWTFRSYPYRPPQAATGLYLGGHQSQQLATVSAGASYPMAERWSVACQGEWGRARSNQQYQQAYAYDYTVTDFLFGVSYSY